MVSSLRQRCCALWIGGFLPSESLQNLVKIFNGEDLLGTADSNKGLPGHYLYPGHMVIAVKPLLVTTILGSCIAVCLWDSVSRIGGMNHFLLPFSGSPTSTPTPLHLELRYGDAATLNLIQHLVDQGCDKKRMQAKIFGGARVIEVLKGADTLGQRNFNAARDVLRKENIPILSSDIGGNLGRKVLFISSEGTVWVKYLDGGRIMEQEAAGNQPKKIV